MITGMIVDKGTDDFRLKKGVVEVIEVLDDVVYRYTQRQYGEYAGQP